ncbi:hypothetical protein [Actinomadura flavalba]|uniref:hypothetical protein n=1 Tax=Actinomadura flavalba TaxID=1120938 RepID=UPI000363E1EA|nr:hypothetical protein [Actinomadura flavalba]
MSGTITLLVPELTSTSFVVAAGADAPAVTRPPLVPEPFAAEAAIRYGTSRLLVTDEPARTSPWDLAHVTAGTAARHIEVRAVVPAADQPFGARLARAVARALADATGGVGVDADTLDVLAPGREAERFTLADGWLGVRLPPYRDAGRCLVDEDEIDGCACVELTTRGLRRFGLPELRIAGVSCRHDLAALNILRATAQCLLPYGVSPGAHEVPRDLPLTADDFAAFWGAAWNPWSSGPVTVGLTPIGERLVAVGAPGHYTGSLNSWLWEELPPDLYDLVGCEPDTDLDAD